MLRGCLGSMCLSCSLSHAERESATFHSSFVASHKVPAPAEEKIRVSSSLLRSAVPTPEAAPAACQTPHRYREGGKRYKLLLGSMNRAGGEGKTSRTSGEREAKAGGIDLQQQQGIISFWITIF